MKARRLVKETVRAAINSWHEEILVACHSLGAKKGSTEQTAAAHEDGRPLSPKRAWEMIRLLQRGRSSTQKLVPMKLTKDDGKPASSPAENAEVLRPYLEKCFDREGTFDLAAILKVRQRRPQAHLNAMPTEEEIIAAIKKMKPVPRVMGNQTKLGKNINLLERKNEEGRFQERIVFLDSH